MSMDRHLAALLMMLSFNEEEFYSTAKPVNTLNTVANPRRQTTRILPELPSVDLPQNITRRSKNVRSTSSIYN